MKYNRTVKKDNKNLAQNHITKNEKKYFIITLILIVSANIILWCIPFEKVISELITPTAQKSYEVQYTLYENAGKKRIEIPFQYESPETKISIVSSATKYVLASALTMLLGCGLFELTSKKHNYKINAEKLIFIISAITVLLGIFVFYSKTNLENEYMLDKSKFNAVEKYVEIDSKPKVSNYLHKENDNKEIQELVTNIDKINHCTEIALLLIGTWLIPLNFYQKKHENTR